MEYLSCSLSSKFAGRVRSKLCIFFSLNCFFNCSSKTNNLLVFSFARVKRENHYLNIIIKRKMFLFFRRNVRNQMICVRKNKICDILVENLLISQKFSHIQDPFIVYKHVYLFTCNSTYPTSYSHDTFPVFVFPIPSPLHCNNCILTDIEFSYRPFVIGAFFIYSNTLSGDC